MKRERILGIPYDDLTSEEALAKIEQCVREGKSQTIVQLSVISLMMARRNKQLRIFFEESDLIIPGGRHLFWAAGFLKRPLKEMIDSSLFIKRLMIQAAELGKRVFLFGGKGNKVDLAYQNLKKEIPRLFVVGKHRGNYRKQDQDDILKAIGKASPDYFFIGLGSPYEEYWTNCYRSKLNAGLIVLIEGLLDVYAGTRIRFRGYKKSWKPGRTQVYEINHPRSFKRLWLVPMFYVMVFIEKIFWKY